MTNDINESDLVIITKEDNPELVHTIHEVALDTFRNAIDRLMIDEKIFTQDSSVLCAMMSAYIDFAVRAFGKENTLKWLEEQTQQLRLIFKNEMH